MSYLLGWIGGLIVLSMEKRDQNVRFHALQAFVVSIAYIIFWIVISPIFLDSIVLHISVSLWLAIHWISSLFSLAYLGLMIFLAVQANQGKRIKLPFAGDFAERNAATFLA